jgi:fructose/tagatose bisphosphate aldolase
VIQCSQGGAAFFAGKGIKNSAEKQEASVAGAIACANYVRAIAPLYGVPVVMHTDHCAKKLLPWLDGMLDEGEWGHTPYSRGLAIFLLSIVQMKGSSKSTARPCSVAT